MVLATDMSCHFQQVKAMKNFLQQPEGSVAVPAHTSCSSHPYYDAGARSATTHYIGPPTHQEAARLSAQIQKRFFPLAKDRDWCHIFALFLP